MATTLFLVFLMVWVIIVDFREKEIPDTVHIGLITFSCLSGILLRPYDLKIASLGLIIGFTLMFLVFICGTMGFGDVKLMAALGTWFGCKIIDVFLLSFIIGAVFALIYYIKYREKKYEVPFGPSIAFAALFLWVSKYSLLGLW